jgi:hypothetical protein
MKKQTRRSFIATAAAMSVSTATIATTAMNAKEKKQLAHHVFFWLKNPGSKEDQIKLIEGVKTLAKIETVRELHVGIPAETEDRDVVDSSYGVSELIFFDDVAGQNTYQDHPIHLKFIENYSHLWEKVVVYDSVDV